MQRRCQAWPTLAAALIAGLSADAADVRLPPAVPVADEYVADGRLPLTSIMARFDTLAIEHGWHADTLFAYAGDSAEVIKAWRTPQQGPALWLLAGIHGEEPAGPNAIARNLPALAQLAATGVPMVVIPLANPRAYRQHWRYPNTPERDWKTGGGYSVGDAEYLLPDLNAGTQARAAQAPGPETLALTRHVLQLVQQYPPRLVIDLHEDELSTAGGYIYSQGVQPDQSAVSAEIVRLLQAAGIPLRASGKTRFGETIVEGVISRDDQGRPIRDGSIDELLAARTVFVGGQPVDGPATPTVIVVETPAFAGSQFEMRVAAQAAVVQRLPELWRLSPARPE